MKGRILKYPIPTPDSVYGGGFCIVEMPVGAKVLHVGDQDGELKLWSFVESESEIEERCFLINGTGVRLNLPTGSYVGTVQQGRYVWHIFEIKKP
jgi:hypothetical protein